MNLKKYPSFNAAFILCILATSFLWHSCEGNNSDIRQKPLSYSNIKHVVTIADSSQSYYVYLPASFNNSVKYPVIFMFDPHGNGTLAIEHGKLAAEMFGYILAASNNSKNGISNSQYVTETLMNDVIKQFPVDVSRMYAAGFSGGGRVASSLALSTGKIRGVISCGAGIPSLNPLSAPYKFELYATAGKHDFNYDEVLAMSRVLDRTDWRHLITAFDAGHAWPNSSVFAEAIEWFSLNAMRDEIIPKDSKLFSQMNDEILTKTSKLITANRFIDAYQECSNGIVKLDGLISVKKLRKKLEEISANEDYVRERQSEEKVKIKEMKLRTAYMQSFTEQNASWWENEIKALKDRIANEKDSLNRQMFSRVKAFLGIVCYSYTARALASNDYGIAEKCISVYEIVEPENPDCYFFKALLFEKKYKSGKAAEYLTKALKLGFSNHSKMTEFSSTTIQEAMKMK